MVEHINSNSSVYDAAKVAARPLPPRPALQHDSEHKYEPFEGMLDCTAPTLLKQTAPSTNLMDTPLGPQAFPPRRSPRIAIKAKKKIVFIDATEIIALEAAGNCAALRHRSGTYVIRESISSIAQKLNPFGFVRIHRCVLVNRVYIEELRRCPTGVYLLRVSGGKEYTITRTYRENLRLLAESWLGTAV
jgi:DNA-binding LytR/AlgR family response regulator